MDRSDPSRLTLLRPPRRWTLRLWAFLTFLLTGLPSALAETACQAPAKLMARLELVFGAGHAGGGQTISERRFMGFLATEVTPRFPDGLSLFSGYGQWRDGKGRLIREPSRLLLIWYVPGQESEARIEAIRTAYKRRFHQQSVLRADGSSCVSF
jgi:hypothetical protein